MPTLITIFGACLALGLVVSASSASAAKSLDRFFGSTGNTLGGEFSGPRDVAVNETGAGAAQPGDVYVLDTSRHRIQVLTADGLFKFAFGRDVLASGAAGDQGDAFETCAVAADCMGGSSGTSSDAPAGEFDDAQGIAIDQSTGDIYVRDRDNLRVQQFDAAGAFVRAWGYGVATGANAFEVCTANCQKGVAGTGAGQFGSSSTSGGGVAVAPIGSPSAGNVFVVDPGNAIGNRRIHEFDPDAAMPAAVFVRSFGSGGTGAGQFNTNMPQHVAVDAAGVVYASDTSGNGRINRYTATAVNLDPIAVPPLLSGTTTNSTSGLEIDPDSDGGGAGTDADRLYVARDPSSGNSIIQQFDNPGEATAPTTVTDTHATTLFGTLTPTGLGVNTATGRLYVGLASGSVGHGVYVLDDDGTGTAIAADDPNATDIEATTATFSGTVDPASGLVKYFFEYSSDGVSFTPTRTELLSGSGVQAVSVPATELQPNTNYRLRLVVRKVTSPTTTATTTSAEATFLTDAVAPTVTTLGATARGDSTAMLQGIVNPNGSATTYWFEYGTSTSYGTRIPVPAASAGAGGAARVVFQSVAGLEPNQTYHYRLVAENGIGNGPVAGTDRTFRTRPVASASSGRGYELVSPADKVAGVGVGSWNSDDTSAGMAGYAAHDADRFAAQGFNGAVLLESAFAYANDWAFADRVDDTVGWQSHSPLTRGGYQSQAYRYLSPGGMTPNFSLFSWRGNGGIAALFPEMEFWPNATQFSALSDWAGRWELFGPTDPSQSNPGAGLAEVSFAQDTAVAVGTSSTRGIAGAGDPTLDRATGAPNTYVDDLSAGLSDTFPGAGVREPVGVCTDGTEIPARVDIGGGVLRQGARPCPAPAPGRTSALIDPRGDSVGTGRSAPTVISRDGSRVFLMSPFADGPITTSCSGTAESTQCPTQLYVREKRAGGTVLTRWISRTQVEDQAASLLGPAIFEGASEDGDKVFFRTTSPLTIDDPNGGAPVAGGVKEGVASDHSWDLYMYDFPDDPAADPGDGSLTRVSAGPTSGGDANSTGAASPTLRFVSADGRRLYFVTASALPGVPAAGDGTITDDGAGAALTDSRNLYRYDATLAVGERWRFVARLPVSPLGACATTAGPRLGAALVPVAGRRRPGFVSSVGGGVNCLRGTPDGAFVTFWTDGRLTADDPDSVTGDLYGYDAKADELTRVSAAQGGTGGTYPCNPGDNAPAPCHADGGIGLGGDVIPMLGVADAAEHQTAFFQSVSRLVPEDTDDVYDVYQWRDGELSLLTPGTRHGAYYKGNDRAGRNVYFATRDRLSWQDHDAVMDIYTARTGGGIPQPPAPATCNALVDACQGLGASVLSADPRTSSPDPSGGSNVSGGERKTLAVGKLSTKALRAAARRGVLRISVRINGTGRVTAVATARLGKRARRIARKSIQARKAGKARLALRLNSAARKQLRRGKALRVTLRVTSPGARPRTRRVRLPGANS